MLTAIISRFTFAQPPGMSNYVVFGGNYYGTLSDVALGSGEICQNNLLSLPAGAALAPDTEDVRSSVVAAHIWSTDGLYLASGKLYVTAGCTSCGEGIGKIWTGAGSLVKEGDQYER